MTSSPYSSKNAVVTPPIAKARCPATRSQKSRFVGNPTTWNSLSAFRSPESASALVDECTMSWTSIIHQGCGGGMRRRSIVSLANRGHNEIGKEQGLSIPCGDAVGARSGVDGFVAAPLPSFPCSQDTDQAPSKRRSSARKSISYNPPSAPLFSPPKGRRFAVWREWHDGAIKSTHMIMH